MINQHSAAMLRQLGSELEKSNAAAASGMKRVAHLSGTPQFRDVSDALQASDREVVEAYRLARGAMLPHPAVWQHAFDRMCHAHATVLEKIDALEAAHAEPTEFEQAVKKTLETHAEAKPQEQPPPPAVPATEAPETEEPAAEAEPTEPTEDAGTGQEQPPPPPAAGEPAAEPPQEPTELEQALDAAAKNGMRVEHLHKAGAPCAANGKDEDEEEEGGAQEPASEE